MTGRFRHRGMTMVFAVILTGAAGALLAVLSLDAALRFRDWRMDELLAVHATVQRSAEAYVASHMPQWILRPPAGPVELDVAALLPAGTSGRATISFETLESGRICRLATAVRRWRFAVAREVDLPASAAPASGPA